MILKVQESAKEIAEQLNLKVQGKALGKMHQGKVLGKVHQGKVLEKVTVIKGLANDAQQFMKLRNRMMSAKTASDVIKGEIDNLEILDHYKMSPATLQPVDAKKKTMDATVNSDFRRAVQRSSCGNEVMQLSGKVSAEGLKRSLSNFIEALRSPLAKFENEVETMSLRIDLEKQHDENKKNVA